MLRAGVIGLGVGAHHLAAYRADPRCRVTAVCDHSAERLAAVAAELDGVRRFERAADLLADPDIDVVSIASYDDDHPDQVLEAIRTGKHCFVEKPLCLYPPEAAAIRRGLAAHPEVVLSSNLILRMSPRFQAVRALIQAGDLGELFYAEGDYLYGRLSKITAGWRGRLDYYSVMHGGGIHMIDLLLWLTGRRITQVSAYGTRVASRGTPFRFDDTVVAIVRFEQGIVGKVSANFGCVRPHFHALRVCGTSGTFENGPDHGVLYQLRDGDSRGIKIAAPYPGVHKGGLIASFVDAIVDGTPPAVGVADVFDAMSVSFAIESASREGRPVDVVYL